MGKTSREDEDRESPGSKRPRNVVKHRENVLQRFPQYYAFITRREGAPGGPWHVVATCMPKPWMDAVWNEMLATQLGTDLAAAIGGDPFEAAYPRILDDERTLQSTHDAWSWFVDRSADAGDPMEASGLEVTVPPAWGALTLTDWYVVELSNVIDDPDAPSLPYAAAPQCFHTVFSPGSPDAEQTVLRQTLSYLRVPEQNGDRVTQGVLKALHLVHANPRGTPFGGGGGGGTRVPSGGPVRQTYVNPELDPADEPGPAIVDPSPPPIAVFRGVTEALDAAGRGLSAAADWVRDALEEMWEGPGAGGAWPGLVPAFAGASAKPWDLAEPLLPPSNTHLYLGSPASAGMGAQEPNPLVVGPHQAFVAVFDVGQGNCNAIYDGNGHILAYYDLGHPWGHMASSRPGLRAPPGPYTQLTPCVCQWPLVILSHFDLDHFKMGLDRAGMHRLTWLAPQQAHGPDGTLLVNAIRAAGGQLHVWATPGGHMRFPWGYLERCNAPVANLNSSGLAAFVCVRDDEVIVRMQQTVDAIALLLAGPLGNGAAVNIGVFVRPVAAALAQAHALAVPTMAAAAVRATVAARHGGVAATPAAVQAFIAGNGGGAAALALALNGVNVGLVASLPAGVVLAPGAANTAAAAIATVAAPAGVPAGNGPRAVAAATPFGGHAPTVRRVCHPGVAGAGGANVNVTQSAESARARAAVAGVPGLVAGLVGAPAGTLNLARIVAASFGASGISAGGTHPGIAVAALRTVVALSTGPACTDAQIATFVQTPGAGGAAAVRAAMDLHNLALRPSLPPLPGGHGIWPPNLHLLATGARAALGAAAGARVVAFDGAVVTNVTTAIAALEPSITLGVTAGAAPFAEGERFVHLNADANFDHIPSLQLAEPPLVVAMTAMHHGSALEDGYFLDSPRIPWAPGSVEAGAPAVAAVAHAANTSAAHFIAETANQIVNVAAAGGPLIAAVAHAGAAAAAAVLGVDALGLAGGLTGLHFREFAQGTATAVLSRLLAANEAGEVAMAAALAVNHRPGLASVRDFAHAAQIARVQLRAGAAAGVIGAAVSAVHPYFVTANVQGVAGALGGAQLTNYANVRACALQTMQALGIGAHQRTLAATLAGAGWRGANAALAVGAEAAAVIAALAIGAGTIAADVSTIMAMEYTDPHTDPADAEEVARVAAEYAMISEAIRQTGVAEALLKAALDAVALDRTDAAMAAANVSIGNGPGPIAYSYGVRAGNVHCYLAASLGNLGHPHPLAILDYEARGWTVRRNAVANADHAGAQGDLVNPCGHVALGWDHGGDRNLVHPNGIGARVIADPAMLNPNPNGLIDLPACADCGQRIRLHL